MVEINGKHFCENCFEEITASACPHCGYDPAASVNDPTMLAPGSILLGKYIIGKVIGKGGFGITYLAYDTVAGRKAAIKEFFPYGVALRAAGSTTVSVASMDNANAFQLGAEKFYDEAKLVSKFNGNPNIVGVYEFFYENDTVYFAMEYLQGHTLKDHINTHGVLTAPQALFIAENVANALMAAHSSSVLHRDISPDNIILCDNGDVKLIDFGAARQVVAEHSQSFSVILKPGFAPLEQYQKKGNQGSWTDIYSLGATIYFALTGDIPEDPMSRLEDDSAFASNQYNIDHEIWEIIYRSTMLKIEDRYRDIFEMKNALSKVTFRSEPVVVPVPSAEQKPQFRTAMPFGMTQGTASAAPQTATATGVALLEPVQNNAGGTAQNGAYPSPAAEPKKSFFRRYRTAVIAALCVAAVSVAATVIVPIALRQEQPAVNLTDPYGSGYQDGEFSADTTAPELPKTTLPPETSVTEPPKTTSLPKTTVTDPPAEDTAPPNPALLSKMFYLTLSAASDESGRIYEAIYTGLENRQTQITLPAHKCANDDINVIYYMVLYENPQFYYVSDCTIGTTLDPTYLIAETDADSPERVINSYYVGTNTNDTVETLCAVHDMLIKEVETVPRYSTGTCTSAYGAIVDKQADDLGFAKAFCYYAQMLNIPCYVVDGTFYGELRAWVRVYIDGVWYNADVYGDKTAASLVKTAGIYKEDGGCFHTYFLTNDTYIGKYGYTPNEEYKNFWREGLSAASSLGNYYIERAGTYIDSSADKAYNRFISDVTAVCKALGGEFAGAKYNSNLGVAPFLVDELYEKLMSSFQDDLKNQYGVELSNIVIEYQPDKLRVAVTFH